MRFRLSLLTVLLMSFAFVPLTHAQDDTTPKVGEANSLVKKLNTDINELEFLSETVKKSDKHDREVLVFRQDERSFSLLRDFDKLVRNLTKLPATAPEKVELMDQMIKLSEGVGSAVFTRLSEIHNRITKIKDEASSLSGAALISAQAYIQNLEDVRIGYIVALTDHLDTRKAMGLSSDSLRQRLDPEILLFAETLTGRIEFTAATLKRINTRLELNPGDADLGKARTDLKLQHTVLVNRLKVMLPLLDRLELESSTYKTVMLQQSSNLSVNFFSFNSAITIIKNGWAELVSAVKENSADIVLRILLFIVVIFIFRFLSRLTQRVVRAASERSSLELSELLKNILVSTSGGLVMGIGVLMALSQVGISLAPMLAGLGVAGFIVGFALQDTLGNFAAGAMILIYRPFDVDDFVEVTGASGLVKKMNLVSTTITTFDNQTLVVPNSKIWGDVIKNVTAQTERRIDLVFGIGYGDDIEHAERILNEIVTSHEKVLKEPEPNIRVHTLGESSVDFIVRPWVETEHYWDVYWDLTREVKIRFDKEGISIPFPQRDVHLFTENETQD